MTAILIRVTIDERELLHSRAAFHQRSLQSYCRERLGLSGTISGSVQNGQKEAGKRSHEKDGA